MILKKLSLIISILGIITLLILVNTIEPKLQKINEITLKDLNKKVKISGQVINIKTIENSNTKEFFQIIEISDNTGKIDGILNSKAKIELTKNQNVTIIGRVAQYKDKLQIQAEKIIMG